MTAPHPDAGLIAALMEFRRIDAELGSLDYDDEAAVDAANEAAQPRLLALLDIITNSRATTIQGHRARAGALWQFMQPDWTDDPPGPGASWDARMMAALSRDLVETGSAAAAPLPPLPSIVDLGRHIGALARLSSQHSDKARSLAFDREFSIGDLVLTIPAETLGDAAVQLCLAHRAIDDLTNCLEGRRASQGWDNAVLRLKRIIFSAVPVVAREAGLDPEEIGGLGLAEFREIEFPDLSVAEA